MPHTVKLSQRFYEKFGHDLVNELVNWFNETDTTYRAELRELNDLNFARFDAKLEQRVTQSEATLEQRITQTEAKLEQRITQTEAKLGQQLSEVKAELIKWMFLFWMGQAGLTVGLVLLVGRR